MSMSLEGHWDANCAQDSPFDFEQPFRLEGGAK